MEDAPNIIFGQTLIQERETLIMLNLGQNFHIIFRNYSKIWFHSSDCKFSPSNEILLVDNNFQFKKM